MIRPPDNLKGGHTMRLVKSHQFRSGLIPSQQRF